MLLPSFQIVSLDFWGTVASFNPLYSAARTEYLSRTFNLSPEQAHLTYKQVKRNIDLQAEQGVAIGPDEAFSRLLVAFGSSGVQVQELRSDMERIFSRHPPLMDNRFRTVIRQLAQEGMVVGVSSNTNFFTGALVQRLMNLPWGFEVYSDEIGLCKPDPRFFQAVLDRANQAVAFNAQPALAREMVHIGNKSACDDGATSIGAAAWLVKTPEQTLERLYGLLAATI